MFLHTGWRSGGTWLWSRCRAQPGVHAFYEPLHEAMGRLRRADIPKIRPNSWRSRHGETEPYFAEYGELIPPRGAGVPHYERRFAFDGFFLDAEQQDTALEAYVRYLLASAGGQHAVLKFCRSLGRVAWFEQRFPECLHAVVLRRPLAQWRSGQRLLVQERNRYFAVAPMLVLARNPGHLLVRQACGALGVRLPALGSHDMAYGMETVWRHVKRQDAAERYRGFLAYWTVTALSALQGNALLIDSGRLARSAEHRAQVEAALGAALGTVLGLAPSGPEPADTPDAELARAQRDAASFLVAHADALAPHATGALLDALEVQGAAVQPARAVWDTAAEAPAPGSGGWWQRLWIAILVALARALQPLRRLHGEMARRT